MGRTRMHVKKKVHGQRRIGVINVRNTSSYGDRPMWQIKSANVKAKKKMMCRTRKHVKNANYFTLCEKLIL